MKEGAVDTLEAIFSKVDRSEDLTREDALTLLKSDNHSVEFYRLLCKANELSQKEYGNRGYIFVQIGLNSAPCSGNCKFCSMSSDNFIFRRQKDSNRQGSQVFIILFVWMKA